jgi:LEA14-like dessication related protein
MQRLRLVIARCILPLAVCLPLTGCSFVAGVAGNLESPGIELQASKVESISLTVVQLVFDLAIHNPNSFALTPHALRYRLRVGQAVVAEGAIDVAVTVPPRASNSMRLPIAVRQDRLSDAAQGTMSLGEIPYDLDVWLAVDSWLRWREIHLAASSVLRLNPPLGLARGSAIAFPGVGWQS